MSVYDLILDQRQNPDDIETYMEKKADLYPNNWFLPHTVPAMLGIHEQNKDSVPERLRNMTGANDTNEGTFQKEMSLIYSHYTAPLQEEITKLRNELKKRVEPKRQRTVYSKENAPTNSRVEQMFVPQAIVSKSGRQIKLSRRAMGIEED